MPYKNEAKEHSILSSNGPAPFKMLKGQIANFEGDINDITRFYNEFPSKIKASNIFPKMAQGSTTGIFTIVVFFDK